jgi:hypothetical protein
MLPNKWDVSYAGILREASLKQGDKEPKEHNNEERQTSDPGNVPSVWHQDVPYWEGLGQRNIVRLGE